MKYKIENIDGNWTLTVYENSQIVDTYSVATQKSAESLKDWLMKKEKHTDSLSIFYHSMCRPSI